MLKNKGKARILAASLLAALLLLPPAASDSYAASSGVIHEERNTQTVTQGVTLENIIRFTTDGWYNFQVLKVDLSNPYISVDTLTNTESVGKTATTGKMAAQRNAVAAVNASFFTASGSGNGFPVGAIVQSSDIRAAYGSFNKYGNSMATFAINNLNEILLDYWRVNMSLTSASGSNVAVEQYNVGNKAKYGDISVFDRKWGKTAIGASVEMPDIFQMVVENGIVTQFLSGQPAAPIPQNGYVVVTRADGAAKLQQSFFIGDSVSFDIKTTPDWNNVKMAVSGSSELVKDGAVPAAFSFNASDVTIKSPKTAVGSSKDGKTLWLVTVDGRQTSSIGLTQRDMALFMKGLGAYNAINMDGGGSTTMVARPYGSTAAKVMNSPSDGTTRNVLVGLGVFTSAPKAPLAALIVDTSDKYIFTNATRAFTVKGVDKYGNPIEVDPASVKWSVSGVRGTFKGNVLRPTTYGEGKVTARVGNISASKNISVLSKPSGIMLNTKSIKLPVGQSKSFSIRGINPKGYVATIEPSDISWKVTGKVGTFSDGVFKATAGGAGYIDAAFGGAHAYCTASVSSDKVSVIDNFETANGAFTSYPEVVQGTYGISSDLRKSGNSSGMLVYDFTTNTDVTRAAYLSLQNGGYMLGEGTSKIGLQVYNDHGNSCWLRAELYDANGEKQVVDLTRTEDWTGWKYIEADVDGIKLPANLTRIYQVLVNPENGEQLSDAGYLCFDDLTVTNSGYPAVGDLTVPKDTAFADDANKAVSFSKATQDSFRFGVLGQSKAPETTIEKSLAKIFAGKITKYIDAGAVVGDGSHESITSLVKKKPVIATHTVNLKSTKATDYLYSRTDIKNSRLIKLDTREKSLRKSDPDQWFTFLDDLNSFKGKNVFIFMEDSPDTFTDKLELSLFKKTVSNYRYDTLRNVWVFYHGDENKSYLENGVRYIESAGYEVDGLKSGKTGAAKYVLVTVKGSVVTYVYKEIDS
ncbi:MAG TPA: phosphodiester glycosidase family protein [Clostridia bacterium]|nr:phosphodiester glycosidase family protein [Clostridia bacterium]